MPRYRSRVHYGELRHLALSGFPKATHSPGARWDGSAAWADGFRCTVAKAEDDRLTLSYAVGEHEIAAAVRIERRSRHFGGSQAYWVCPCCGRRCCRLYFVGAALRCRRCVRAIYRVQSVDPAAQALHRFRKLRARIRPGTEDARLDYFPRRPKGLRRVTYQRIKAEALRALARYHAALDVRLLGWLASLGFSFDGDG